MATMTASNYSVKHHAGESTHYGTDRDDISTTLTVQTGCSSDSRNSNLPRIGRHGIRLKAASSFPNLLNLYQEPIMEETPGVEPAKKHKGSKRGRRKKDSHHGENEDTHEKRARQEMRQLRMDAVAREQLEKFDNYVSSMKQKVEKQREERKKYNEILQERLKEQEEAERKKLRLHRGPKHVYVHDRSYLKSLPVSNYCKATRMADDLQKKGVLRTRTDMERFWSKFSNTPRNGEDIFADTSTTSVNYPKQWMGSRQPEIKITNDDDEPDMLTDAASLNQKQLPPIKKKKKQK